jgi:hypothetical protein
MKFIFTFFIFIFSLEVYAQKTDTIKLSDFKLCDLTIDQLKQKDPDLKQTKVEEMDLCSDGFVQDSRFENRIGYESKLYPGVIFQKYQSDLNTISKIHLTRDFKGFLPNGNYVDLKTFKLGKIIGKMQNLKWITRDCSDYINISNSQYANYFVKINKDKLPKYPVDKEYYNEQPVEGIDIIADCYSYYKKNLKKEPLIILEGKEVSEDVLKNIKPEDVESLIVLKDKNAIDKYGEKGRNGVIEIYLKKKK